MAYIPPSYLVVTAKTSKALVKAITPFVEDNYKPAGGPVVVEGELIQALYREAEVRSDFGGQAAAANTPLKPKTKEELQKLGRGYGD